MHNFHKSSQFRSHPFADKVLLCTLKIQYKFANRNAKTKKKKNYVKPNKFSTRRNLNSKIE